MQFPSSVCPALRAGLPTQLAMMGLYELAGDAAKPTPKSVSRLVTTKVRQFLKRDAKDFLAHIFYVYLQNTATVAPEKHKRTVEMVHARPGVGLIVAQFREQRQRGKGLSGRSFLWSGWSCTRHRLGGLFHK